jgi:PTS system nitrogen regulatory IIA component
MDLSAILKPGALKVIGQLSSKKRLFQEIAELAGSVYGVEPALAFDGLQERETLGATGVGHGIALPHARIEDLTEIIGAFVRLERPMDFDSVDRQPVDLIFALFAPKEAGVDHLKALALVSRTMRDTGTCAKLRANTDPAKLYAVLTEAKANHQAA